MATSIYLDYAAATPLDTRVRQAMQPYLTTKFYNPSAGYSLAREVQRELTQARAEVAACLGAKPSEIIFTAGGTEANNLAIHGVMSQYPQANIVISALEHSAVVKPAENHTTIFANVTPQGLVDIDDIRQKINDQTVLVSCMYANNEIGTIQPIAKIARLVVELRKQRLKSGNSLPLLLHTDACQAPNYLDIHVSRLGVDLMSLNGSKIYGPKQSGALYVKGAVVLRPLIQGGGQERGLRSGTENVAGAIGFAKALVIAQAMRPQEVKRMQDLQQEFYKLVTSKIPSANINGSIKHRLPNNVHLTISGQDNERLLMVLDSKGIMAAAGSACSASKEIASTVLRGIGLSDKSARSSIRFSMGRQTTKKDVTVAVQTLAELI